MKEFYFKIFGTIRGDNEKEIEDKLYELLKDVANFKIEIEEAR